MTKVSLFVGYYSQSFYSVAFTRVVSGNLLNDTLVEIFVELLKTQRPDFLINLGANL